MGHIEMEQRMMHAVGDARIQIQIASSKGSEEGMQVDESYGRA